MSIYERLLRGQHDGRERTPDADIEELARKYGIQDPALARALYSQACDGARLGHGSVTAAYERRLQAAAGPPVAQGKRTRTAAVYGEPTRWAAPTPGASPGKRSRTMTMAEEMAKREMSMEAQRRAQDAERAGRELPPAERFPEYDYAMSVLRDLGRRGESGPEWPETEPSNSFAPAVAEQGHTTPAVAAKKSPTTPGATAESHTAAQIVPLPFRDEMERHFNADLQEVTVEIGHSLPGDALAAAAPDYIAFASASPSRETVAHEVAHILQYRSSAPRTGALLGNYNDAAEREARCVAADAVAGRQVRVEQPPSARIHLQTHPQTIADAAQSMDSKVVDGRTTPELTDAEIVSVLAEMPGFAANVAELFGGLAQLARLRPMASERVRAIIEAETDADTLQVLIRRDGEVMRILRYSETVSAGLDRLAAELAADEERDQEAALDVVRSAQGASECTYRQIMLGIHNRGELYLDFVIGTADQVSEDELLDEIGADARHAQSVADRRDHADRAASRAARSLVGRTVARSEGIFFDTDVKLAEVLDPAAGLPTQDEALGFARISGRACTVVQAGRRWHVFALDENLDYDDIWQTDAWQEHRTRLVPVGAAARLLVTRDGYVVRVRDGRFFGGDQSRRPAAYMNADAELSGNRVEELTDAQAVRLFKQLVRDDILLRLDDA
ncbi:MAG: DUF4157 domain-containing protein, partial [Proteobacteria bacterium]|nr:DUF4157 domain-containing protein [Pseudomonadota bacterium]